MFEMDRYWNEGFHYTLGNMIRMRIPVGLGVGWAMRHGFFQGDWRATNFLENGRLLIP